MSDEKGIRKNVVLDQESMDIIEFFELKEMKASGLVRLSLKAFYEAYVKKALESGEMELDENGIPSTLDAIMQKRRRVEQQPVANHPDDVIVEDSE